MINKRGNEVLLYLSKKNEFVTSDEISNEFQISAKTVYRVIKKINENDKQMKIVHSEKGRGYKLDYENYIKFISKTQHKNSSFTPSVRCNQIMRELLIKAPQSIDINNLYAQYFVSDTVIFNDEKIICEKLKEYNLTYVRKNKKCSIIGDEEDIRKAIANVVNELELIDVNAYRKKEISSTSSIDMYFVLEQLSIIESALKTEIHHPYDVNIFTHLYVMICRLRTSDNVLKNNNEFPNQSESNVIADNQFIYSIALNISENIMKYVNQTLSEAEVYNLFQYFLSSRLDTSEAFDQKILPIESEITYMYMFKLEESKLLFDSQPIYFELYQHIKPMINRLRNKIKIKNRLIESIKNEYPAIFKEVENASVQISEKYDLPLISEDENAYITLYFAKVLEQNNKKIKAIITCTTGVGTSELLKVKVKKNFSNIDVVDVVSLRDLEKSLAKIKDVDLVITTSDLNQELDVSVVLVSPMLTSVDQEQITKEIEGIKDAK